MNTGSFVRVVVTTTVTVSSVPNLSTCRSENHCNGSTIVVSTPDDDVMCRLTMLVCGLTVLTNAPVTWTTFHNRSLPIMSRDSLIRRVSVLSSGFTTVCAESACVVSVGLAGMTMSEPVMCLVSVAMHVFGRPVASVSANASVQVGVIWVTFCHHANGRMNASVALGSESSP